MLREVEVGCSVTPQMLEEHSPRLEVINLAAILQKIRKKALDLMTRTSRVA